MEIRDGASFNQARSYELAIEMLMKFRKLNRHVAVSAPVSPPLATLTFSLGASFMQIRIQVEPSPLANRLESCDHVSVFYCSWSKSVLDDDFILNYPYPLNVSTLFYSSTVLLPLS